MSENQSLKEKTAKGLFWGGFSNGIQQLLNLLFGIFLARLLTPSDYGMVGMLAIFSLIASSIQESGFTAALVNKKEVTHNDYNAVFWFNAAISLSLYLLLFLCAPLIADFYDTPELTPLARYSFIGFFIASLGISHSAYLLRNLMVKQRALSSVIGLTVSGITGVTLAYFGFSYWGIATQSIVYVTINTACYWHFTRWRPSLQFNFTPIKEMFGFSGKLLVTNVFNHINNNLFSVILGKFYSEKEVGYYNQANKWCGMGQLFISRHVGIGNRIGRADYHHHHRQVVFQHINHANTVYQRSLCSHRIPLSAAHHQQREIPHLYVEHHSARHNSTVRRSVSPLTRYLCHARRLCIHQYTVATDVALLRMAGNRTKAAPCTDRHSSLCCHCSYGNGNHLLFHPFHREYLSPLGKQDSARSSTLRSRHVGQPFGHL